VKIEKTLHRICPLQALPRLEERSGPAHQVDDQRSRFIASYRLDQCGVQRLYEAQVRGPRGAVIGQVQPRCSYQVQPGFVVPRPEYPSNCEPIRGIRLRRRTSASGDLGCPERSVNRVVDRAPSAAASNRAHSVVGK